MSLSNLTLARATDFVGRATDLDLLQAAILGDDPRPRLILITGNGGIGKTRLLNRLLEISKENGLMAFSKVVDAYDVPTQTPNGLAEAMNRESGFSSRDLPSYKEERERNDALRLTGDIAGSVKQREVTRTALITDLRNLAQKRRVVIALDTAERMVYSSKMTAIAKAQHAPAWDWILHELANLPNVTLLVAGRERASSLLDKAQHLAPQIEITQHVLQPFTEADTVAYFEAVARLAELNGNAQKVERLRQLSAQVHRTAHLYSGGRPIYLALIVDLLVAAGFERLPGVLRNTAASAASPALQSDVERELISPLIGSHLGDTLVAMGRAPKGVDAPLLAALLGVKPDQARQRLGEIRDLACVKPRGSRYFLHDEMYAMLAKQVYEQPADSDEASNAAQTIEQYYQEQLARVQTEINDLYAPLERDNLGEGLNPAQIGTAFRERRRLMAEATYYLLRRDPARGFRRWYRYAREAILTGDILMDIELQSEIAAFVDKKFATDQQTYGGISLEELRGVLAVRDVARTFAERNWQRTIDEAQALRQAEPRDLTVSTQAVLKTWEASSRVYLGGVENYKVARRLFDEAIDETRRFCDQLDPQGDILENPQLWRGKAVLALALRASGYARWSEGQLEDAKTELREAVEILRRLDVQIELASALNELGNTSSTLGDWDDGTAFVNEALEIRRRLGHRGPVLLSLNTLGLARQRAGLYDEAIRLSEQALSYASTLEDLRGAILALIALAESRRRQAATMRALNLADEERQLKLLDSAYGNAARARHLTKNMVDAKTGKLAEPLRLIEALIEIGCANRDLALLYRNRQPHEIKDLSAELIQEKQRIASEALEEAADLAHTQGSEVRYLDALVNLAWLYYYVEDEGKLNEAIMRADRVADEIASKLNESYRIAPKTVKPDPTRQHQTLPFLWVHLGKLDMLRGHRALRLATKGKQMNELDEPELRAAIRYYTLGMEYTLLYNANASTASRVREEVYQRLRKLDSRWFSTISRAVDEAQKEFRLEKSAMRGLLERRAMWSVA